MIGPDAGIIKILVLGNFYVGKTTLISNYTKGFSPIKYIPTIGLNITTFGTEISNKSIDFQIFDIAGHELFESIRTKFYKGARGALVLFDLTNKETLEDISIWINEAESYCEENFSIVILGNKKDLEEERTVTKEMINEFLTSEKRSQELYMETSALYGDSVIESFQLLGKEIIKSHK